MPPLHPQTGVPLWMDSAYLSAGDEDPIAIAVAQMRWWRRQGLTPWNVYELLGRQYVAPRGGGVWSPPSSDDVVWLIAEIYQTLSTRTLFAAATAGAVQLPLPFKRAA